MQLFSAINNHLQLFLPCGFPIFMSGKNDLLCLENSDGEMPCLNRWFDPVI